MRRQPQVTLVGSQPINFDWRPPGPICKEFVKSDALMCGIRGPFGSGKSTACIAKLLRNFTQQKPDPDGVIRRRTAIIRNTYPMLEGTTIKTWHVWVPPTVGKWREKGPPRHLIVADTPKVEWEIRFQALDTPEDLKNLLSMDLSDCWVNEAREIPRAIIDGLTGRVGRYPKTIRNTQGKILYGCAAPQIIMDTNSPDTDHWWAKLADFPDPEITARNEAIAEQLQAIGALRPGQELNRFFAQPSGRSPAAENLQNLPPGYYERLMADKSEEWIKIYVDGEYGFVMDGKPVYPEYHDSTHCREFQLIRGLPLHIGLDFGRTPAAAIGQRTPMGAWRIHSEVVAEDMGALEFGPHLKRIIQERYPDFAIGTITGDPSGTAQTQTRDETPFTVLRAGGIDAHPAHTNDPMKRRETFAYFLNKMIDGQPGMLIHPNCKVLRKALAGGYHYRRVQVSNDERYTDEPVKNMSSHIAEAAQYMLLGAGEARSVLKISPELIRDRPMFAGRNTNPFGD